MIDFNRFGVAVVSGILALALIVGIVTLIALGHSADIPDSFEPLLGLLVGTGVVGAALGARPATL